MELFSSGTSYARAALGHDQAQYSKLTGLGRGRGRAACPKDWQRNDQSFDRTLVRWFEACCSETAVWLDGPVAIGLDRRMGTENYSAELHHLYADHLVRGFSARVRLLEGSSPCARPSILSEYLVLYRVFGQSIALA